MVAKLSYFVVLLSASVALSGCLKVESYPDEPVIAFESFTISNNEGLLKFSFTDGDGNFGLREQENNIPPFNTPEYEHNLILSYFEKIDGTWQRFGSDFPQSSPFYIPLGFNARVEYLIPEGTNKTQKGEVTFNLEDKYYNPASSNDSCRFSFYILDRDLNQSNLEFTTPFLKP